MVCKHSETIRFAVVLPAFTFACSLFLEYQMGKKMTVLITKLLPMTLATHSNSHFRRFCLLLPLGAEALLL